MSGALALIRIRMLWRTLVSRGDCNTASRTRQPGPASLGGAGGLSFSGGCSRAKAFGHQAYLEKARTDSLRWKALGSDTFWERQETMSAAPSLSRPAMIVLISCSPRDGVSRGRFGRVKRTLMDQAHTIRVDKCLHDMNISMHHLHTQAWGQESGCARGRTLTAFSWVARSLRRSSTFTICSFS